MIAPVTITDERIVSHMRSRGMRGPIGPNFIAEYRLHMARFAVCRAVLDAGGLNGGILEPERADELTAASTNLLQHAADALLEGVA